MRTQANRQPSTTSRTTHACTHIWSRLARLLGRQEGARRAQLADHASGEVAVRAARPAWAVPGHIRAAHGRARQRCGVPFVQVRAALFRAGALQSTHTQDMPPMISTPLFPPHPGVGKWLPYQANRVFFPFQQRCIRTPQDLISTIRTLCCSKHAAALPGCFESRSSDDTLVPRDLVMNEAVEHSASHHTMEGRTTAGITRMHHAGPGAASSRDTA